MSDLLCDIQRTDSTTDSLTGELKSIVLKLQPSWFFLPALSVHIHISCYDTLNEVDNTYTYRPVRARTVRLHLHLHVHIYVYMYTYTQIFFVFYLLY